jgi:hypothetical protein
MKSSLLVIIWGLFVVPCLAQTSVLLKQLSFNNQSQILRANLVQQQESPILSSDYKIAKQALEKAIYERDEATLKLGLMANSMILRQEVFRTVANLSYQWFVPDLVKALEENQTITDKGIKTVSEQKQFNKSIISALARLTGLEFFPNEKILPAEEFLEIQNKSLEWYETYQKQIEQAMQQERLMMSQEISILSKYHYLAKRAFEEAVLKKDKTTLRLGLKAFSLALRSKVVDEIKRFDDKSFVPNLITALEGNQAIMSGGSETTYEQNLLDQKIVSAIESLTGLQFPYFDKYLNHDRFDNSSQYNIEKILKESREWCETYQQECKPENKRIE